MALSPAEFRQQVGDILIGCGFRSRARRWYKDGEELTALFDLQKSHYGDSFYVNVGLSIPELDGPKVSSPFKAAIDLRLEDVIELDDDRYSRALNLESELSDFDRMEYLRHVFCDLAVPRLTQFQLIADLRDAIENDETWRANSPGITRAYLHIADVD